MVRVAFCIATSAGQLERSWARESDVKPEPAAGYIEAMRLATVTGGAGAVTPSSITDPKLQPHIYDGPRSVGLSPNSGHIAGSH